MPSGSTDIAQLVAMAQRGMPAFELFLRVMATVTSACESRGFLPIVVGEHAVAIYTRGDYATRDIDLVAPDAVGEVLSSLGFTSRIGERHWYHDGLDVAIEVPSRDLAGATERVVKLRLDTGGHVYVIGVEDLIVDRLRACVYWGSTVDCEWAERLLAVHRQDLDLCYISEAIDREPHGGAAKMRTLVEEWVSKLAEEGA